LNSVLSVIYFIDGQLLSALPRIASYLRLLLVTGSLLIIPSPG
jgi:hypothetical protein